MKHKQGASASFNFVESPHRHGKIALDKSGDFALNLLPRE